ncbi:RNA polymerase sigma factor [Aureibacillus halotolerans]|nr:sigma-70 family RNA polymerase sigma factor [Aureibacillus halotolerans]
MERKWIKAIKKQQSQEAADLLVRHYYNEIYSFVYKEMMDQELALDITQEIFISMLKGIHNFSYRSSFRTWLYKVAKSRLIDYYRSKFHKQSRRTDELHPEWEPDAASHDVSIDTEEQAELAMEVFLSIEETSQRIVSQKVFRGDTFLEIAATLELNESTVKSKYYAALRKIKKEMGAMTHERQAGCSND